MKFFVGGIVVVGRQVKYATKFTENGKREKEKKKNWEFFCK